MNTLRRPATICIVDWKDGPRCVVSVRREAWRWPALLAIRSGGAAAASSSQVHVLEPGRYLVVVDEPDALERRVRRLELLGRRRLATARLAGSRALVAADRAQLASLENGARAVPAAVALAALAGWLWPGRAVEIQYHDVAHRLVCRARAGRLAALSAAPPEPTSARDFVLVIAAGASPRTSSITLRRGEAPFSPPAAVARAIRALSQITPRELLAVGGALGALAPGSFPEIPTLTRASSRRGLNTGLLVASLVLLVASSSYWLHSMRALEAARATARELQARIDAFAARGVSHH
ncbi:MAG: hypothetical protein ACKVX7_04915 [Planctomycetota bacterium]